MPAKEPAKKTPKPKPKKNTEPAVNAHPMPIGDAPRIHYAMNKVRRQLAEGGISKNERNSQQGYNYRGIDDVYNAISIALADNGVNYTHCLVGDVERVPFKTAKGRSSTDTRFMVKHRFHSVEDGSYVSCIVPANSFDTSDKGTYQALSQSVKYALLSVFTIPVEGETSSVDNDGNGHQMGSISQPANAVNAANPARPRLEAVKKPTAKEVLVSSGHELVGEEFGYVADYVPVKLTDAIVSLGFDDKLDAENLTEVYSNMSNPNSGFIDWADNENIPAFSGEKGESPKSIEIIKANAWCYIRQTAHNKGLEWNKTRKEFVSIDDNLSGVGG